MASEGPFGIPPGVEFVELSSNSESPEENPYHDHDTLRQARIRHLEHMAELRRKIWVVESETDSVLRGHGAHFPPDLSDNVASLRVTLLESFWRDTFRLSPLAHPRLMTVMGLPPLLLSP